LPSDLHNLPRTHPPRADSNSEAGIFASKRDAYSLHCHQLAKMASGGEVLNAKLFRNSSEAGPHVIAMSLEVGLKETIIRFVFWFSTGGNFCK